MLDGGIEGRPQNVLFYATSNRRHLMPRDMIENERSTAINPNEAIEEKVSLSDRFGLWLGFHNCDQATFLAMVDGYAADIGCRSTRRSCMRRRSNGRLPAAPGPAAWRGSSSRRWRGGWAWRGSGSRPNHKSAGVDQKFTPAAYR